MVRLILEGRDKKTEYEVNQNIKRYQYFFPVPNIFKSDTDTFSSTKFFQYLASMLNSISGTPLTLLSENLSLK